MPRSCRTIRTAIGFAQRAGGVLKPEQLAVDFKAGPNRRAVCEPAEQARYGQILWPKAVAQLQQRELFGGGQEHGGAPAIWRRDRTSTFPSLIRPHVTEIAMRGSSATAWAATS